MGELMRARKKMFYEVAIDKFSQFIEKIWNKINIKK